MVRDPLIIIPARLGSKGIPNKNFRLLNGRSPLDRAIDCAKLAGFSNIVVTTDHPDTALLPGNLLGMAPLHTDTCSMVDVVLDVLQRVPGSDDQRVLLAQPTQPLRQPKHLHMAIGLLFHYYSVASVIGVEPAAKLYYRRADAFESILTQTVERRQEAFPTFACDGTIYGFQRWWFLAHRIFHSPSTYMLRIPKSEACRLDDLEDWAIAEQRVPAYQHNSVV